MTSWQVKSLDKKSPAHKNASRAVDNYGAEGDYFDNTIRLVCT